MKDTLRRLLPPIALDLWHRLRPAKPQYVGVYERPEDAPDDHVFESPGWLEIQRRRLEVLSDGRSYEDLLASRQEPQGAMLAALLANQITVDRECRVLDFAGGSAAIYHQIRGFLSRADRVQWDVVDRPQMAELGREFLKPEHRVRFMEALPDADRPYEIVFVCTALQYVFEWREVVERLLAHRPRYLVLTRLLAGPGPTWITTQRLIGSRRAPCIIVSEEELDGIAGRSGYTRVFRAPAFQEPIPDGRYHPDIPRHLRIPFSLHVVYAERSRAAQERAGVATG